MLLHEVQRQLARAVAANPQVTQVEIPVVTLRRIIKALGTLEAGATAAVALTASKAPAKPQVMESRRLTEHPRFSQLCPRARRVLLENGVYFLHQLKMYSEADLSQFKGMGPRSAYEVMLWLRDAGGKS